jgi:aerobic-type carbon monoxide dehydrogenase small subunit (CoxS/CutS family)
VNIPFKLNDKECEVNVLPHLRLNVLLQQVQQSQMGSLGCSDGYCGKCLILLDNKLVYACLVSAFEVRNRQVTTASFFMESELAHHFEWALTITKSTLCPACKPARLLVVSQFLSQKESSAEALPEYVSLVQCSCCSVYQIDKLYRFMKKMRSRYAK